MVMPRKLLCGVVYPNKYGSFEVVEYKSKKEVTIKFCATGSVKKTNSVACLKGRVKDLYFPSVVGVGFIGNTTSSLDGKVKNSYHVWRGMLRRCYQDTGEAKTYFGIVKVCDEWLSFEEYEKWYDDNYIEGYEVDKDFTSPLIKIYSPDTCSFIPNKINAIIGKKKYNTVRIHKGLPVGVSYHIRDNKYTSQCWDGVKLQHFGYHDNPTDAFLAYKVFKESLIKSVAKEYYQKGSISKEIYENLMSYIVTPYY